MQGDRAVTDNYGRGSPENRNGNWDDAHADTGATNDWHDQIVPSTKPTLVGGQPIGTPSTSQRDAAIDAIKRDLSKPKRLGTADVDMDDDDRDGRAKDPNADDSFDNDPGARGYGKQRRRA